MIFDCVVSASLQDLSNIGPRVTILSMTYVEDPLLLFAPWIFLNHWIQMVVPALSTLLSDSSVEMGSNLCPLLSALLLDKQQNHPVLFLCPRTFDKARIQNFLPAVKTLNVSSPRKVFSDLLPVFLVVSSHRVG